MATPKTIVTVNGPLIDETEVGVDGPLITSGSSVKRKAPLVEYELTSGWSCSRATCIVAVALVGEDPSTTRRIVLVSRGTTAEIEPSIVGNASCTRSANPGATTAVCIDKAE